jgi:hypothetical protein
VKTPAALFPTALALGGIILVPWPSARAQDTQVGPTEIDQCQTISQPGSYRLVNNLSATTGNCLVITAGSVTIDLAGLSISGTSGTVDGIVSLPNSGQGVAVRNGSISGFGAGVILNSPGSIVEGLRVFGIGSTGISAQGIVRGNTVTSTTLGPAIVATGTVTGNYVTGTQGTFVGDGELPAGIAVFQGSTVIGNTATSNKGMGIFVQCPSNVTDNTATGNGLGNLVLNGEGCNNTNNVAP